MQGTLNDTLGVVAMTNLLYPVGIRIKFENSTDPNTCWPWQTWKQVTDGRVEVSAGGSYSLGSTGGEASHTLTQSELPSVRVGVNIRYKQTDLNTQTMPNNGFIISSGHSYYTQGSTWVGSKTSFGDTEKLGSGAAHNNMQPYVAVNTWVRTA